MCSSDLLDNFAAVVTDHLGGSSEAFQPRWSGDPNDEPTALAGIGSDGGSAYYVAVWHRPGGSEIHFITPDYAADPTPPLIGAWKMRDRSLSSVGSVMAFPIDRPE